MWATLTGVASRALCYHILPLPPDLVNVHSMLEHSRFKHLRLMDHPTRNPPFSTSAYSNRSQRSRGFVGSSSGVDKIDALGRQLTRILRHKASEFKLDMRTDGYVKVQDLLKLDVQTFANIPLLSHTIEDIREAVRRDNKQRFSLLEENGEFMIRANQGHSLRTVETKSLLKPILSPQEIPVCVHGTYKSNLESILREGLKRMARIHVHFSSGLPRDFEVISGMRRDVNMLIFLDVKKALEEGMKLYMSDNRVILTEGFNGVVPVKYFQKIETWPQREPIPLQIATKEIWPRREPAPSQSATKEKKQHPQGRP